MPFIGPGVFRFPSIFTSFSTRDWTSLRESFYFILDSPTCAMHNCRCRWYYAIRRWGDACSGARPLLSVLAHPLKILDKNAAYSRYRHVLPHRTAWYIRGSVHIIGPVRRAGENARHAYHHDCPARCDYEVRELERGYRDPRLDRCSLRCARPGRAEETLDESVVSPHIATRAKWCIRGWVRTAGAVPATGARARLPGPLASVRRTTAMDILIPTTSATRRKKAVTKGKEGGRAGQGQEHPTAD
ncbi:hypothetical protein B0H13DRAFT_2527391 [Mycena leptocephala]|nr:hypothetical protein B0H13DRAFT_2527391 [Mycena leptocephala]